MILSVVAAAMTFGMGQAVAATNEVSALLQKGLFEEEANRNLDAAIKAYQSVVAQTEKDRQFAATAVFRLGECYRKQGNTNAAAAQYQRILREFSDQAELARLSREQLGPAAVIAQGGGDSRALVDELRKLSPEKRRVAVQQKFPNPVLNSLMEKMVTTEQELVSLKSTYGDKHPEVVAKAALLSQVQKQIDDQMDGIIDGLKTPGRVDAAPPQSPVSLDEMKEKQAVADEYRDIKNLQIMIRDNPDLINAYSGENTPLLKAVRSQQAKVVKFLLDNKADPEIRQNGGGRDTPLVWAAWHEYREIVEMLLAHGAKVNSTDNNRKTALHWAAEMGFKNIAEILVANKAEVDARDKDGVTPLHVAAGKGFKAIAELLAAHGADMNNRDNNRITPLLAAARNGNRAIVEWLLANKADVNAADKDGWTPLAAAIRFGRLEIAKTLLAHGANVEAQIRGSHERALHFAVGGNWPEGIKLLLENRADVNATCQQNGPSAWGYNTATTSLMLAANSKFDDLARVLIDAKADVNLRGSSGETALMIAIQQADESLVNLLLDHHADPNIADVRSYTPLFSAVNMNQLDAATALLTHGADVNARRPESGDYPRMTALQLAVDRNTTNLVKLLLEHGADPNTTVDTISINNGQSSQPGFTPLLTAVLANSPASVKLLLDHKAEPSRGDNEGRTPLHWAVGRRHDQPPSQETAELLLAAKADINARDKNGRTPLHYASSMSFSEMVEFLIAHGADVNAKDNSGKTPLDVAGADQGPNRPGSRPVPQFAVLPGQSGNAPLSYQWFKGDQTPASGSPRDAASILREHGGVLETELSTIRAMRKGDPNVRIIARRDPNSYNRCTLFEAIAKIYVPHDQIRSLGRGRYESIYKTEPPGYRFPDFSDVRIHRLTPNKGTNLVKLDLTAAFAANDCSKNLELEWGDVVEISEADHKIDEKWLGLEDGIGDFLVKCLQRNVDIIVKGQVTRVTLLPKPPRFEKQPDDPRDIFHLPAAGPGAAEKQIRFFSLNDAIRNADVILASSDLKRVKVRRTDPATGKKTEMTFNLEKTDPETDLWLKDGDVIEIPEKPGE